MSKERRLGRGLEALLGLGPARVEPGEGEQPLVQAEGTFGEPAPIQHDPPAAPPEPAWREPAEAPRDEPPHAGGITFDVIPAAEIPAVPPPLAETPADEVPESLGEYRPEGNSIPPSDGVPERPTAGPQRLDVSRIDGNPMQPRQEFDPDETHSLAESLTAHGLLQPVVVRRVDDRYQLVAGERRLRAAREAGWTDVPANVIEADDQQMAELAIVENLQRKDLNPLEKAAAFQRYLEHYGCTQEELANRLRLDRSTVSNLIRLLELPEAVQDAIRRGKITQGHARALLPLGEEREQIDFCHRIQAESLSVRQTESLVQEQIDAADRGPLGVVDPAGPPARTARVRSEHLAALEQELRLALGTKVGITHNARGRGKLVIHFRNHEEFERLRQHLGGPALPNQPQARAG